MRILIAEDDRVLADGLLRALWHWPEHHPPGSRLVIRFDASTPRPDFSG